LNDNEIFSRAFDLLARETTMVLATSDVDGNAAAAPLFYCADDKLRLRWLSSPSSLHSRNIAVRPHASVSVFTPVMEWRAIRGVQMRGVCAVDEDASFLGIYRRRFSLGPELEPAIAGSTIYSFRPQWLRYIDNAYGFGFRAEVTIEDH
jgi:uncharacterized protein YhbP (UPF0306 family)